MTVFAFWIFKPPRLFSWKSQDHNVGPPVVIDVVSVREEIVTVSILRPEPAFETAKRFLRAIQLVDSEGFSRRSVFVAHLEIRPFIPIRPRDNVVFTVVIEVTEVRTFTPKLLA